jgi:hypothetical protein
MKDLIRTAKLFVFLIIAILCWQFLVPDEPDISKQILGKWEYKSHLYRKVGRYGQKEVDAIKSSILYFNKDKVYFTNIKFIDTCIYSELLPKAFFDREDKDVSYFQDGPLAVKYSKEELGKFIWIDLNCKDNGFGTFYLNADTLILKSTGGITFFFTKKISENSKENLNKGK